jgi:hypothetical protein
VELLEPALGLGLVAREQRAEDAAQEAERHRDDRRLGELDQGIRRANVGPDQNQADGAHGAQQDWRGLTARGAIAGILAGGAVASAGIITTLITGQLDGVVGALLVPPAVVSVPVAFATMGLVSMRDRERPRDVDAQMLALHAPEELGLEAMRA